MKFKKYYFLLIMSLFIGTSFTFNSNAKKPFLLDNFEDYLNGFSDNVKEIINKLKLKAQIKHMSDKDILLPVIAKFLSPHMNFSPNEKLDPDGKKLTP